MRNRVRAILLVVPVLLLLGLAWFALSSNGEVSGLRNVVHYRVLAALGGARVRAGEAPGSIVGTVRDGQGQPVARAQVLVASPLGDVNSAESGPDGRYLLDGVPPGRYVPVAGRRGHDDALPQTCVAGLCWKDAVSVRPGRQARGPDLALKPLTPLEI
ncbi:MAG: carboxypeptidase regulatory-like domain-containing protein, partial [Anaerolineaceae bacterium]|nr:carboxypeptidase regulatory-like domain-containing protein [Anaerolineaceae bacterium]